VLFSFCFFLRTSAIRWGSLLHCVVGWLFPYNGSRLHASPYKPAVKEGVHFIREKHVFANWEALISFSFESRTLFIPPQTSGLTEPVGISFQALRLNERGKEKKKKEKKRKKKGYQLLELLFGTFQGTWNTWKFLIYVIYDVVFYNVFIIVLFYKWRCRISPELLTNGQEVIFFSFF